MKKTRSKALELVVGFAMLIGLFYAVEPLLTKQAADAVLGTNLAGRPADQTIEHTVTLRNGPTAQGIELIELPPEPESSAPLPEPAEDLTSQPAASTASSAIVLEPLTISTAAQSQPPAQKP